MLSTSEKSEDSRFDLLDLFNSAVVPMQTESTEVLLLK